MTPEDLRRMERWLENAQVVLGTSPARCPFDIQVRVWHGEDTAFVRIEGHHTNVVILERNGERLRELPFSDEAVEAPANRQLLTVKNIVEFADEVRLEDVRDVLNRQIELNMAIAR